MNDQFLGVHQFFKGPSKQQFTEEDEDGAGNPADNPRAAGSASESLLAGERGDDEVQLSSANVGAVGQAADPCFAFSSWALSLFLLSLSFLVGLIYFVLMATPLMDKVQNPKLVVAPQRVGSEAFTLEWTRELTNASVSELHAGASGRVATRPMRRWFGITEAVEAAVWVLILPAMLFTAYVWLQISLLAQQTIDSAHAADRRLVEGGRRQSACVTMVSTCRLFLGVSSPYFFVLKILSECLELSTQALAVEGMSRSGYSKGELLTILFVILLNASSPLIIAWLGGRLNRAGLATEASQRALSRWISTLLLFDAMCELFYSAFPLLHSHQLFQMKAMQQQLKARETFQLAGMVGKREVDSFAVTVMWGVVEDALFGARDTFGTVIKILSRAVPLFAVPIQIRLAFRIRNQATQFVRRGISHGHKHPSKRHEHYHRVPMWLAGLISAGVATFVVIAFVRLIAWGDCANDAVRASCIKRSFPIFDSFAAADRGCACNTLVYNDTTACVGQEGRGDLDNRTTTTNLPQLASEVLNSSTILGPVVAAFILGCPDDTKLLETLGRQCQQLEVLNLYGPDFTDSGAASDSKGRKWSLPATFGRTAGSAENWPMRVLNFRNLPLERLPERVFDHMTGLRRLGLDGAELTVLPESLFDVTTLKGLSLKSNRLSPLQTGLGKMTELTRLLLTNNELTMLPDSVGQLTSLVSLDLYGNAFNPTGSGLSCLSGLESLQYLALAVANNQFADDGQPRHFHYHHPNTTGEALPPLLWSLTQLRGLFLGHNGLKNIPAEDGIARLTGLQTLDLGNNLLSSLPSGLFKLTALKKLYVDQNRVASIPAGIDRLNGLVEVQLGRNKLSRIPSTIGRLTAMATLGLSHNELLSIPPSVGDLANLTSLDLRGNDLVSIPPSLGDLGVLEQLYLDDNQLGSIPGSFHKLTSLWTLGVTRNPKLHQMPHSVWALVGGNLTGGLRIDAPLPPNLAGLAMPTVTGFRDTVRNANRLCTVTAQEGLRQGDRPSNPVFDGGGFIGTMSVTQCQMRCNSDKDRHGRPCVAIGWADGGDFVNTKEEVRSCALFWGCNATTLPWAGGSVYRRNMSAAAAASHGHGAQAALADPQATEMIRLVDSVLPGEQHWREARLVHRDVYQAMLRGAKLKSKP